MPGYYGRVYPVERVSGGQATGMLTYNAAAVAPHATTNRWSYTVPSSTAAEVETVGLYSMRDAVAAPANVEWVALFLNGTTRLPLLYQINNTLGFVSSEHLTQYGFGVAGDAFVAQTTDTSTGGSHTYILSMRYREFSV